MTITDTRDMVLVHRVFRREFGLLPLMVRGVADGDTTSASRVFRHATEMIEALHHHHQNEDELLWPRLLQRAPLDGAMAERMQAQHNVIGELLARAEAALPAWQRTARAGDRDALAGDLGELHARLEEHLDEEETHILPIVGQTITPTEWDELAERGFAAMPKRRALVFLGHILESASPDERSRFLLKRVPPPVRLLYRLIGRRAFTHETAALRAALPHSMKTPASFTPPGQKTEKRTP
jgi:hemerythrin-like domain-containing protein